MKHLRFPACALLLLLFAASGCTHPASDPAGQAEPYTTLTMYSNVTFWNLPEWSLSKGSVTAGITEQTGIVLDASIPRRPPNAS